MAEIGSGDLSPASLTQRSLAWRVALLLTPLLLLVVGFYFLRTTDPDYWWHVRVGQVILETRAVPRVDLFSYATAGQPWTTHTWLTELLFFLVQGSLGYWANALLFGVLGAATLLAVYGAGRLRGLGELGAALFALIALLVGAASANVRPQMVTTLLMALTVLILTHTRLRRAARWLWLLPPIFLLWANLHGGFVLGLAVLGLTVAGELLASRAGRGGAPVGPLALVALLSTAATLVTPNGLQAWTYPLSFLGRANISMEFIAEWQSPDFHEPWFIVVGSIILVTTVIGLVGRPLQPTDVFWALLFGFLALRSVRNLPLYGVVVVPMLGGRLVEWLPVLGRPLAGWRRATPLLAVWLLIPVVLLYGWSMAGQAKASLQTGWEPSALGYPVGGADYLEENHPDSNLFNQYGWGGYLVYRTFPERRVFVDGSRADVYGDALMEDYRRVVLVQPGWQQVLDEHDVQVALLAKGSPAAVLLAGTGEWEQVFEGPVEVVLVRRNGKG